MSYPLGVLVFIAASAAFYYAGLYWVSGLVAGVLLSFLIGDYFAERGGL